MKLINQKSDQSKDIAVKGRKDELCLCYSRVAWGLVSGFGCDAVRYKGLVLNGTFHLCQFVQLKTYS